MSNLYLIRHGQAGIRDAYDSLSPLGVQQSKLLGKYFASQGIRFTAAYSGELRRQQETAEAAILGYGAAHFPEIATDSAWNEFDLERMYRDIAPQLCVADSEFRSSYEAMRLRVRESAGLADAIVHRRWLPCDTKLVNAWICGEYEYAGESWQQFCQRVIGAWRSMTHMGRHENIAIFTSATPITISTAQPLDIPEQKIMKLAAVLHNSSFTLLQCRDDHPRLFSFNATPHLVSQDLRTFR